MRALGVSRSLPLLKAINLVTSKPASDIALAAPTLQGQMLTLVPWRGRAIVGTGQSKTFVQPDGAPTLLTTPLVYDHAADGATGAMTVVGVKYTTARRVAQNVTERVAKRLGTRLSPSRTATTVLPGAGIADHEALAIETARACGMELSLATIRHLIAIYAERSADIVRLIRERTDLRAPVTPTVATLGAEVVHVIRHEMAVRLSDVVIRRTGMGAAGPPDDAAVRACAEIAARELEWEADRIEEEIAAVNEFYAIADA
jgi:glycerol-3-phosphate dehydrogenase